MLTSLKLTRGKGQLVEPSSHLTRRKHIHSPQVSERHSPSMARAESHERVPAKNEDLKEVVMELREMMKILMERNILSQGEGSNPSMHKEVVVTKLQVEMEGMVLLHHPLLHHLLLLLLLPVQNIF
jgi:hypothetical protein